MTVRADADRAGAATAVQVEALMEAMRMLQRTMSRLPAIVEARFGLAPNRFQAMVAIEDGASRVQDVATMTWASVSAASRTIDALVQDGLVDRRPDPADRRATLLTLTDEGQRRIEDVHAWRTEWMTEAIDGLGPERTAALIDGLEQFGVQIEDLVEAEHRTARD